MTNALVLVAGGLDSLLVAKLIKKTNISHKFLHIDIGLTHDQPIVAGQRISKYFGLEDLVKNGIEIDKIDVAKEFYAHLLNIKDFSQYNACLEYKIFILKKAKQYLQQIDAQFIITGDVLEQRPVIQGKEALQLTDKYADVEGLVFRPLSARSLEPAHLLDIFPTLANITYDMKGFTQEREDLAKELGITHNKSHVDKFPSQEVDMGRKAFEIFEKQNQKNLAHLNRVGMHFRLDDKLRLVIGRTPFESNYLKHFYQNLDQNKAFSFSSNEPRMVFGFVYGDNDATEYEQLSIKIFSTISKSKIVQLYDAFGSLLGSQEVEPLSQDKVDQYTIHTNDLFCPILTFQSLK